MILKDLEKQEMERINKEKEFHRRCDEQYNNLIEQGALSNEITQCECGWYDWNDYFKQGLCDACYGKCPDDIDF